MKLIVEGQSIRPFRKGDIIVDGSTNFVDIEFECSNDWKDYLVTAQFIQVGQTINVFMGEERSCKLPGDIREGSLIISIFGSKPGEADKATNIGYETFVNKAAFSSNSQTPIPPTPDLYAQLLEEFKKGISSNPDWNQNDSEKSDYIKNRPFYESEEVVDYTIIPHQDGEMGILEKRLGLVAGKQYTVECLLSGSVVKNYDITTISGDGSELPSFVVGLISSDGKIGIYDNTFIEDSGFIEADSAIYMIGFKNTEVDAIKIYGIESTAIVIHKLDDKFLNFSIEQEYNPESENPQSGAAISKALKSLKIANENLEDGCVTKEKIADGTISTEKISDGAITSEKIGNNAVKKENLAGFSVQHRTIANGAVMENNLADSSVTTNKIADKAIKQGKYAEQSITNSDILAASLDMDRFKKPTIVENLISEDIVSWAFTPVDSSKVLIKGKVISSDKETTEQVFCICQYKNSEYIPIVKATLDFSGSKEYYFSCLVELIQNPSNVNDGFFVCDFSISQDKNSIENGTSYRTAWNDGKRPGYIDQLFVRFGDVSKQKIAVGSEIEGYNFSSRYVS